MFVGEISLALQLATVNLGVGHGYVALEVMAAFEAVSGRSILSHRIAPRRPRHCRLLGSPFASEKAAPCVRLKYHARIQSLGVRTQSQRYSLLINFIPKTA